MAMQLNDTGPLVRKWQIFLQQQGFYLAAIDGIFGVKTKDATIFFQKFYGIQPTGIAGSITLAKAYSLGFNPDNEPPQPIINNDKAMMQWIKNNLGAIIRNSIINSLFTEDMLAGICARETGFLFTRYANQQLTFEQIFPLMKGDYGKRKGDAQKQYHGFGFWQIDIDSYPAFVNSGKWQDPAATAAMAVSVLNSKKAYLESRGWNTRLSEAMWERAVIAAYNCGEGNVDKALSRNMDVDTYTYTKDYSKEVTRYRIIYATLA